MAENHPVGFQWVMEAKERGATVIHVDPRFTRTSAVSDIHVALRAGTDIAFLGGLVNYVLTHDLWFREYVTAYTNAASIIREDFVDTEDLDGLFSGFDPDKHSYDASSWEYEGATAVPAAGHRDPHQPGGPPTAGRRAPRTWRPPGRADRQWAASRTATRRCSIHAASSRSSSGTSPATRRRWSRTCAAYQWSSSCGSPRS
jgi:formate dehydrogenase major subunit